MAGYIGQRVSRLEDDSPCPRVAVIISEPDERELVWVAWLPDDAEMPGVVAREALDELTPR